MSEVALPIEKLAYGVDEACAALNVGTTKLYQLLTAGKIEGRMEGRRTLITRASLQQYIDSLPAWEPRRRLTPRRSSAPRHP